MAFGSKHGVAAGRLDRLCTWMLAARPTQAIWLHRALIWQAATPYLYARPNGEDRIIIGGEDEKLTDADARDSKITAKADIIRRKFKELYPRFEGETDRAWARFFGLPSDGLPRISALPGHRRGFRLWRQCAMDRE